MAEEIDLLDSEVVAARNLLVYLQNKYSERRDTFANLQSLRKEAEDEFAKIGLDVVVDTLTGSPVISVVGRRTKEEFDHERMGWEVKRGIADEIYDQEKKKK